MVKNIYLVLLTVLIISASLFSQIQPGLYCRGGLFSGGYLTMNFIALPNGSGFDYIWISPVQSASSSGNYNLSYNVSTSSSNAGKYWGDNNATVTVNTPVTFLVSSADAHWVIVSGKKYVFTLKDVASGVNSTGYIFEFGGTPATITTAVNSTPAVNSDVTVTANMSGPLVTGQTVYVRWSTSSTYTASTVTQMTGSASTYTATIPGQPGGTTIYYYCFSSGIAGLTSANCNPATINATTPTSYSISGNSPTLLVTPTTLTGFGYFPGSGPSTSQTYSLSGTFLTGFPASITVSSPTDYEISTDNGISWGTSGSVAYTSATLSSTTIYVRLKAGLSQGNFNNEIITNAGGGATTVNVACSGTVLKLAPTNQATGFTASNGSPSTTVIHFAWIDDESGSPTPDGYLIRGSSVGFSSITAPVNGTSIPDGGLDKNTTQGTQLADITGLSQGTIYYFKIYSFSNSGANILYNLVNPQQSSATTSLSTYYSKSTGNLEVLSSWGSNPNGTGNPPANFTTDGVTFVIKNNPAPTIGGAWTVSGASSKIQVGDSTTAINFTIPSALTATNLDIMNNATVTIGSNITLTGTVNVKTGGTLNCSTYVVSGTAGVFNLNSGGTLKIGSPLGITTSGLTGNIQTTGTRTFNASGIYVYNGTAAQVTGNGLPASVTGSLKISNTISTVTQSQATVIGAGGTCTIDSNATLTTGAFNFTSNTGTVTVNGNFQIDPGGWGGSSGTYTYGNNGTLTFNNTTGSYVVNAADTYWPASIANVNCKGTGGVTLSSARTVTGTFQISGPIINANYLTLNGSVQINSASGTFAVSPTYGASSTLIYNQGGSRTRGNEWTAVTTGPGYPNNIQISNSTTLDMNTTAGQCAGNITIDSASTLTTTSGTLTVLGNVAINGTMTLAGNIIAKGNWTISGTQTNNSKSVTFNGTSAQSITGPATFDSLVINNSNGVTIHSDANLNILLTLTTGSLIVDSGKTLSFGTTGAVLSETAGNYIIGAVSSTPNISAPVLNIAGLGISIDPNGSSLGSTTITRISGLNGLIKVNGKTSINRRWKISPATQPTSANSVTFSWVSDDDNSKTLSSMYVWMSLDNGSNWTKLAGPLDGSARSITFTTTSLADFTLTDQNNSLPVELTSFAAIEEEGQVILNWKTATEINCRVFEIEKTRSGDGTWQKLGEITGAGSSNSLKSYSFCDNAISAGKFEYRLKMVDYNGTFSYSAVENIEVNAPKGYKLFQNYPNPFNPSTTINYQMPSAGKVTIRLYAITGQLVKILVDEYKEPGYYSINANLAELSSGTYFYKLDSGIYSSIKKMMLIK
jgi:hypothetical protein